MEYEPASPPEPASTWTCQYCGRAFPSRTSLICHLKGCPLRRLNTDYKVGDFKFTICWNPKRNIGRVLTRMAARGDAAAFVHVCKFLEELETIAFYKIEKMIVGESPQAQASP